MLDLTGILFSTILMLIVVVNALLRDKTEPWFWSPAKPKKQIGIAEDSVDQGRPGRQPAGARRPVPGR